MSEAPTPDTGDKPLFKIWKWTVTRRDVLRFLIAFAISLAVGRFIETVTAPMTIAGLYEAQTRWMDSLNRMNPFALFGGYMEETARAWDGVERADGSRSSAHIFSPLMGFVMLVLHLFERGAVTTLLQIGLGALVVTVFNLMRTNGKSAFFGTPGEDNGFLPAIVWPAGVIAAASLTAFALQLLMMAALALFQWITGLAAMAAGATGFVGFCWYCVTKLGEKGAEHALTPKI